MPPKRKEAKKKKKADGEETVGYNVNSMTTEELKMYSQMLEREIEELRKQCSFFESAEGELINFYQTRQQELSDKNDLLLRKDIEVEDVQFKIQKEIDEKEQSLTYMELLNSKKETLLNSETDNQLENVLNLHQKELNDLKNNLSDKEKELEAENKKMQMAKKEATRKNMKILESSTEYEKELLGICSKSFSQMFKDSNSEFHLVMESLLGEASEAKKISEHEFRRACTFYKEKVQSFFKNLTKQDLETVKKLNHDIYELESEIKTSSSELKSIQKRSIEMKSKKQQRVNGNLKKGRNRSAVKDDVSSKSILTEVKIKKLEEENKNLREEIEKVEEEVNNLRNQFTGTLCKVRKHAETKSLILEKKLQALLSDSNSSLS